MYGLVYSLKLLLLIKNNTFNITSNSIPNKVLKRIEIMLCILILSNQNAFITYSAESELIGNIVDWTNSEWELINMKETNVEFSEMCKASKLGPIIVPEKLPAAHFRHLCNKLGGRMFVITNEETRKTAVDLRQSQNGLGSCNCKY